MVQLVMTTMITHNQKGPDTIIKETILQAQVLLDTLVSHDRERGQELKHYKHTQNMAVTRQKCDATTAIIHACQII